MKANAPEKLYYAPYGDIREDYPITDNDIEYIRKDAFIEKAVEWLKEHKEVVETEDNGIMGWIPDYFIEDFRKEMEESNI